MSKKMTHKGYEVAANSTFPKGFKRDVELRETKAFWITKQGTKYRKATGDFVGDVWAGIRLDLTTITPLDSNE